MPYMAPNTPLMVSDFSELTAQAIWPFETVWLDHTPTDMKDKCESGNFV